MYWSLGTWLLLCFIAGIFFFVKKPYPRPYYAYGQSAEPYKNNEVIFNITKVIDGKIYGNITVKMRSNEVKNAIDKSVASFVQYETMYGNPQIGDWIKVDKIYNKFDEYILKSDNEIKLYAHQFDSKLFPFDQYYVWFIPTFIALDKEKNIIWEKHIPNGTITFRLSNSFSIEDNVINPVYKEKAGNKEFLFKIKRPSWYLWFLGGLAGLLTIPVLILSSSEAKSMSIDVIALLLSFVSVRTFLIGESTEVYVFDLIFCFLALISGLIIIYKLNHREYGIQPADAREESLP